ncbi:hypothetical protein SRABI123_01348 [Pseudomonas sp. Bi123]|uniref:hypothetical protein n=1 Tax=Pseudomonas sp. Bi123 TaxID=2821121 RepID=UPI001D798C85|nr:hypothetical protein [Pseudomonas sp. Bi123]CAH0177248.1 hypothetical protein SRABI123_01348 [Pseudomonas sp. Bi123]
MQKQGNKEIKMSDLASEKISNLEQDPAEAFTIFEQSGISIELTLPGALSLSKGGNSLYAATVTLKNDTEFTVTSAEFKVTLNNVYDNNSKNMQLATVGFKGPGVMDQPKQEMSFTLDAAVLANGSGNCSPKVTGCSNVQWLASMNNGQGTENFTTSLTSVQLTLISDPETKNGPTLIIL